MLIFVILGIYVALVFIGIAWAHGCFDLKK